VKESGKQRHAAEVEKAARISIFGAAASFLIAAVVGVMVDSVTLLLEAAASFSILVAALLMRFAAKKIQAPPDDAFHYGYHKYETLTSVIQRILIMATCVVSIKFAVQDILHAEEVTDYGLPAVAMFFSGLLSLGITVYLKRLSGRVRSQMVRASALHWLSDTALSFGVCAGFILGFWIHSAGYSKVAPYVDPVMALILAGVLLAAPLGEFWQDLSELLDAAPAREVREKVRDVLEGYGAQLYGMHRLRARKSGQMIFVEACFLAGEAMTVRDVGALALRVEEDLKAHFPECDAIVHFKARA
jgi:cation diffusion facilitator family transporter